MILLTVLFYILSSLLITSSVIVVFSINPIISTLFLIVSFLSAGSIWIILDSEFLGILLILIYVGAVTVLFLFVVMMLDINNEELYDNKMSYFLIIFMSIILIYMTSLLFWKNCRIIKNINIPFEYLNIKTNIQIIGTEMFTKYLYAFEIIGIILCSAIISVISLNLKIKKNRKSQCISDQVSINPKKCIHIIKNKSVSE